MKLPKQKAATHHALNRVTESTTGGLKITRAVMKPPAKVACAECPLRRDAEPGYLGGYSAEMYAEVLASPASLACHITMSKGQPVDEQRHCVGACAFRANVGYEANSAAMTAVEQVGPDAENFFATYDEFVAHHAGAQVDARRKP